jgi:hypothetical protein
MVLLAFFRSFGKKAPGATKRDLWQQAIIRRAWAERHPMFRHPPISRHCHQAPILFALWDVEENGAPSAGIVLDPTSRNRLRILPAHHSVAASQGGGLGQPNTA